MLCGDTGDTVMNKRNAPVTCESGMITGRYLSIQRTIDTHWEIGEVFVQDERTVEKDSELEGDENLILCFNDVLIN